MNRPGRFCCVVALTVGAAPARAQLGSLTSREAKQLVEMLPEVQAALKKGNCPSLEVDTHLGGPGNFWIQARGACWHVGDGESLLIGNYIVDRRKGIVDSSAPRAIDAKATALIAQARGRILSMSESLCLAAEGAGSEFGVGPGDPALSVKDATLPSDQWRRYSATLTLWDSKAIGRRLYEVSPETGSVSAAESGAEILAGTLTTLRANMLDLREPPSLSVRDVLEVAEHVPWVASKLSDRCSSMAVSTGFGLADELYVSVRSGCGADVDDKVVLSVNVLTGAIVDPERRIKLHFPEAQRIAEQALARLRQVKRDERSAVESRCRLSAAAR